MIDWISLDDVLYRWDGHNIVCETDVGYSTKVEGNHLDGLDIIDISTDAVVGQLFVDFTNGSLKYEPFDSGTSAGLLHYSVDGRETEIAFSQLPAVTSLHDVIAIDDESDIWSSIASSSQVDPNNLNSGDNLDHTHLLDDGNNSLDLVLSNIDGSVPASSGVDASLNNGSSSDIDSMHLSSNVVDPLDTLHFLNSGIIG